jgi:hypothetical protein
MKKLIVLAAMIAASVVANAAAFKWSGANVYGPDGTTKFSGTAYLYCDALSSSSLSSATVANGAIAATTFNVDVSDASIEAGTMYDFYFVITTDYKGSEVSYTSAAVSKNALGNGTQTIGFGNQQSATQAAGAWGAVPEPTSGLLMLLGMAGLALRRRRA